MTQNVMNLVWIIFNGVVVHFYTSALNTSSYFTEMTRNQSQFVSMICNRECDTSGKREGKEEKKIKSERYSERTRQIEKANKH